MFPHIRPTKSSTESIPICFIVIYFPNPFSQFCQSSNTKERDYIIPTLIWAVRTITAREGGNLCCSFSCHYPEVCHFTTLVLENKHIFKLFLMCLLSLVFYIRHRLLLLQGTIQNILTTSKYFGSGERWMLTTMHSIWKSHPPHPSKFFFILHIAKYSACQVSSWSGFSNFYSTAD